MVRELNAIDNIYFKLKQLKGKYGGFVSNICSDGMESDGCQMLSDCDVIDQTTTEKQLTSRDNMRLN